MPRRQDAQRASERKSSRGISEEGEASAPKPIEAQARSKLLVAGAARFEPGLYLVATPIGNLRDVTLRALDLLAVADLIACEDTRVSAKLLAHFGLSAPLAAYHEHNAERMRPKLIERLKAGAVVALISDAGTPLVSDPGWKLVRAALADGIRVSTLPGPSAALAGLLLSGLPSDRFLFAGFLPSKSAARKKSLAALATVQATLIFFETAPRLAASLADMAESLGDRPAAVARELTKLYEEVHRQPLAALAAHYRAAGPPKGEIVVLVAPPASGAAATLDEAALDRSLSAALATMSVKDASAAVAAATGQPRRLVYQRALALSGRGT
ncbi:MAG TPA: 16S rRNA (cytidine(1402)-2'-O)-methyltransferase [Stellaceae bacterium]|nr:16S rRNA (cytidine(1402)-2'-O)-methyltransferase [Stellaceae bacterium]